MPTELSNVVPEDLEWVDHAIDSWDCSRRWSLRGQTPSPALLRARLWEGVMMQQAVRFVDGSPAALLQLTNVHLVDGVAEVAVLAHPNERPQVAGSVTGFVDRAFRDFPLRKLGVIAVAGDLDVPAYFGLGVCAVGRMPGHVWRPNGTYEDLEIYDLWRDEACGTR